MNNTARAVLRQAKNYTKGYTDIQVKVREATSNDPWNASGAQMQEIADATYHA
jgi:epsin